MSVVADRSRCVACVGTAMQLENRKGADALAAAGLTHDSQAFAGANGKVHAFDGIHPAGVAAELDREVLDTEKGLLRHSGLDLQAWIEDVAQPVTEQIHP